MRIGGAALAPATAVDAFGPDVDPSGSWHDELLVSGSSVVVIGYSSSRGGTEIGLFDLPRDGSLADRGSWQSRPDDYYSSRNCASRLVGDQSIFYTSPVLAPWLPDYRQALPAFRRWQRGAMPADFRRIAPATRICRSDGPLDPFDGLALHTVTRCDLAQPELRCESTALLGPTGRSFYVSPNAVYVRTAGSARGVESPAGVFRLPLDGSAPSGLKARGIPIGRFSFLESDDGHLNVLLRRRGPTVCAGPGAAAASCRCCASRWRRRLPRLLRGLVRQCAADLHRRARVRAARLRTGRGPPARRAHRGIAADRLRTGGGRQVARYRSAVRPLWPPTA